MTPPSRAPTADELLAEPVVRQAIEDAWRDSLPADPLRRHEEGGWIYIDVTSGQIEIIRSRAGGESAIDLQLPPVRVGWMVVGKFHSHPNPTDEGWSAGPSERDVRVDDLHGVPDLIRADDGVHVSGPTSRRGGLKGNPGYPD